MTASLDPDGWQRLKRDFARLADLTPAARAADLAALRADHPMLHDELVSLLAAHDARGDEAIDIEAAVEAPQIDPRGAIGQRFGAYRVVREIGRGGMGAVFLAERDDGAFERLVAVKIVGSAFAGPEMARRLRRERQILARLKHPHIAGLLDAGVTAHGEPYFVMEYVDGVRIDAYCEAAALSAAQRIALVIAVCRAVEHAHAQRIIHRDLKPSNILVTGDGAPMLLDFGIARLLDEGAPGDQTITEYRAFTPDYAAPEQERGEHVLTPAADVFSLGRLLGGLLHAGSRESDSPLPREPLPRSLDRVLSMACRREPQRRYASAGPLADDLARVLADAPVEAPAEAFGERAARHLHRRWRPVAVVSAIAVTAALAYGVASGVPPRSAGSAATVVAPLAGVRSIAVLPLRAATAAAGLQASGPDDALRLGLADAMAEALALVPTLTVRPTAATIDYLDGARDPVAIGRTLGVDAVLDGHVEGTGGTTLRLDLQLIDVRTGATTWRHQVTGDRASLLYGRESLPVQVPRLLAPDQPIAPTATTLATQSPRRLEVQEAYLQGTLAMAASVRQASQIFAARDAFERAIRLDPDFAQAQAGLATAHSLAGALTILAPAAAYPKAQEAARRALARAPELAAAHVALADVAADYRWDWDTAEASYKKAIALAPRMAMAHQTYAEFLARMGRFAEAADHSRTARALDPTRVNYVALSALFRYLEHRFDEAIAESQRALDRDPRNYLALLYMSVSHAAKGEPAAGLAAARRATALTGGAVPDLFVTACNSALMDDTRQTRALLGRLEALARTRYVDPFHFVAIHAYRGDIDAAFAWLERSYEQRSYWMTSLRVHPAVDALRGDPRFADMLRRMRLD